MRKSIFCALATLSFAAAGAHPARAQSAGSAPAYIVIEFKVKNADTFRAYSQAAPATVTQYGGKFLIRAPKSESVAGDSPKGPFIVLSFASTDQAKKWASSPEYTALVPLRDKGADTRAFIVEGASP